MKIWVMGIALAAAAAAPALAAGQNPDVRVATAVDGAGSRSLQFSIDLNAPAKAAWDAFLDPPTVLRWESALAVIDARQGGSMEESYTRSSPTCRAA